MTRRGTTLLELMLVLVAGAVVAGSAVAIVISASRLAARSARQLLTDRAAGALGVFLREELRDGAGGDVVSLTSARIALARPIGSASLCGADDSSVVYADTAWRGTRAPAAARDVAILLVDPIAETWDTLAIAGTAADRCATGAAATRLVFAAPPGTALLARIVEPVELAAYRSGAYDWLGIAPRSGASSIQPFAGPLAPGNSVFTLFADSLVMAIQPAGAGPASLSIPLAPP